MLCVGCGSAAVAERAERTAQGYRRFRCRQCGKQWNERTGTVLNWTQYPSDIIALVVLWRLRYKLALRDLPEMFAVRGMVFSHEAVREWEAKLTPALAEDLRRVRRRKIGRSWYVDETYLKVDGRWCYVCRAIDRSGALVDVLFSEHRNMKAARMFFRSAKAVTPRKSQAISLASRRTGSRPMAATATPAPSAPNWASMSGTGPTATSTMA